MKHLLIVDYNLSRVNDVQQLRLHARRYELGTILIHPDPVPVDREISDVVIDLNPRQPGFVAEALQALQPYSIAAGLVFSDNAVHTGALLLEALGLPVDNAKLAMGAFSKAFYREAEQACRALLEPQRMFVPAFRRVTCAADLRECLAHTPAVVLKPACEGNNRGVIMLSPDDDPDAALHEVAPYLADGVICEERIPFAREFSHDGVGHLAWLTEKLSAAGRYPVEVGQVVPANVTQTERNTLCRVGRLANLLVGQCAGPFHNEIKLSDDGKHAAIVEPNRRPAGMRIWTLAHKVYGTDFYQLWLDAALGKDLPSALPPACGRAATVMLGAPLDGTLAMSRRPDGEEILRMIVVPQLYGKGVLPNGAEIEWFDFNWLSDRDRNVVAVPRDNADFVAQVCLYSHHDNVDMAAIVTQVQSAWRDALAACIVPHEVHAAA